jgi:arabinofuranosyltransferase
VLGAQVRRVHDARELKTFALALLLLLIVAIAHALAYDTPFEDAYITYRYAEHFAAGHGLVYNVGDPVDGYSSALWTLLLGAFAWLGAPLPVIAPMLSLLAGLGTIAASADLARRQLGVHTSSLWPLLPAALLVAHGGWAYYASSGMETTLFSCLVTGVVWLVVLPRTTSRLIGAGILMAMAAITRPEGIAYIAFLFAALAFGWPKRDVLFVALTFVLLFVPYFIVHWSYYGYPFPNTYYAKASPSGALFVAGLRRTEAYLTSHGYWAAVAAIVYLLIRRRTERLWYLAAAVVLSSFVTTIMVGGDAFALYRFMLPQVPFGAIAVVLAVQHAAPRLMTPLRRPLAVSGALIWLFLVCVVPHLPVRTFSVRSAKSERQQYLDVQNINANYFVVGEYLRRRWPPKTLLATNAAGIVPYASGLPTLDMLGLNDRHIAHQPIKLGRGVSGHEKYDAAYVLARKPDVILLGLPMLAKRPLRPGEIDMWIGQFLPFLPGDRLLWVSEEFRRDYAPTGVNLEGGHLVFFVRRPNAQ